MLDAVVDFMPSPLDVPAIQGIKEGDTQEERHADDKEPFAALAFKIATDSFVGNLTFFRVYSGVLNSGDTIYNPVKGKKERIGRICRCTPTIEKRSRKYVLVILRQRLVLKM